MKLTPRFLALCLVLYLPTKTMAADQSAGLDINDAAVLFPLDANKKPFPSINLSESSVLVPQDILDHVIGFSQKLGISLPDGASLAQGSDWWVTAFRYDPCAPDASNAPDKSQCQEELRLVAQPVNANGPIDTALHILYDLGQKEASRTSPALQDLFALKRGAEAEIGASTAGRPLGTHPLLKEGLRQNKFAVSQHFSNYLAKHAQPGRLKKITMMGLKNGSQTSWIFFGGNVVKGQWSVAAIPNLPAAEPDFVELDLNSSDRVFYPQPEEHLNSTFGFFNRFLLKDGEIEKLRVELHRIENPAKTNRNNRDCLSCHSATTLKLSSNTMAAPSVVDVSTLIPKGITAFPENGLLQRHRLHWNLHALGYFGPQPTLSQRTVYEAAFTADRLNRILGLQNPGPDCSAVQDQVQACIVNNQPDCLKLCKPFQPETPKPAGPEIGKPYQIVSQHSGKCLEPERAINGNGAKLKQADCISNDKRQQFLLEKAPSDASKLRLKNEALGLCVDIDGPSLDKGASMHFWACHSNKSQRLSLASKNNDGTHVIQLEHSTKCVDIDGPSKDSGRRIHQWSCHGRPSQNWLFKPQM